MDEGINIGIDIRPFVTASRLRGIGVATKALVEGLIKCMPSDTQFHYLNLSEEYEYDLPENDRCVLHSYFTSSPIVVNGVGSKPLFSQPDAQWLIREQVQHFIRHSQIDVMLFPSPLEYGNPYKADWFDGVVKIGILYDLIPLVYKDYYEPNKVFWQDYQHCIDFFKSLDFISSISEASKTDAVRLLNMPSDKFSIVHCGINSNFRQFTSNELISAKKMLKRKYRIKTPYLLTSTTKTDFRKNIPMLIQAYARINPSHIKTYPLIIVGNMTQDEIAAHNRMAMDAGVRGRVICTGFVPDEDLVALYNAGSLFVFPSLYEGFGLPIMESMACGTPVVTSDCSSMKELAEDYAVLVDPTSIMDIAQGMTFALENTSHMQYLASKALPYSQTFTWERAAIKVADLIKKPLHINPKHTKPHSATPLEITDDLLSQVATVYKNAGRSVGRIEAYTLGSQLAALEDDVSIVSCNSVPRILYDMSVTRVQHEMGYVTGIQRVVLELFKRLSAITKVLPVSVSGYTLMLIDESTLEITAEPVALRRGDVFVMPELRTGAYGGFDLSIGIDSFRDRGIKCYAILYDIIPITHPWSCTSATASGYEAYLQNLMKFDGIIAISQATADSFIQYCKLTNFEPKQRLQLGYSHLGSDNSEFEDCDERTLPKKVADFFAANENIFLMVGTIEPRKGNELVLEAFNQLWSESSDVALCVIGRVGWKMDSYVQSIMQNPQLGHRLLFIEAVPDHVLKYAYLNSSALIQASAAEGFGLPLIEAAKFGLPVICSDIPVFREVTAEHALFFSRNLEKRFDKTDVNNVVECIREFLKRKLSDAIPDPRLIPILSWSDSAENVVDLLLNKSTKWYELL